MQAPFSSKVAKESSFNLLLRQDVSSPFCATVLSEPKKSGKKRNDLRLNPKTIGVNVTIKTSSFYIYI